jgi:D-alanyl-D-alanine carboxypeptidase/D-alanyl-D-alanine-endopeptidase (penicillin-binding protein 4)
MRRFHAFWVAVAIAATPAATPAAMPASLEDALPPAVAAAFQRAQIPAAAIGLVVRRVGAGERVLPAAPSVAPSRTPRRVDAPVLLSLNADRPMNPASTMKIVTTYAALEMLGPAFTWKTVLASNAAIDGDMLDGDLYLRGAGDPKFVLEHLWAMLRQLRARGVRTLAGDVVVDRSLFDAVAYDPAAFDSEPYRPYNVGPDALLFNFKSVTLHFWPDDARREVRVGIEPLLADFSLGPLAYNDGPCGDWRTKVSPDFSKADRIVFSGSYPGSCGEQTWNVAVLDHRQYLTAVFRSLWAEVGGHFAGVVRDGIVPADARVLVAHESPSLADVVRDINKFSNNVMARELFLSLSTDASKTPATVERSQRALRSFYDSRQLPMPELVVDNGSGLSRRERVSAASMTAVLESAWASPLMPEFVSSLPLVGVDGTMKKRLTRDGIAGQAHIKTGTLADVRAVAGYILAASGYSYVVVLFVNHANAAGAQAGQDALLRWVYENG